MSRSPFDGKTRRISDPPPRSVCKLCGELLLVNQPAVWLTAPMGLSHKECQPK